jgi:NitT/TauT family transport system substrate-binding protein
MTRGNVRLFLLGLASLAICGCHSSSSGRRLINVRVAVPSDPITYLPVYLARELGFYGEEGLDVTIEEVPGGSKGIQAMLGGSVDVAASFVEFAIQLAMEGRRVQSFLTLLDRPGLVLVASPASRRGIKRVEDLRGAIVGVSALGSGSHRFVNYILLRHGVRTEEVSIIGIGLGATSIAAIERGKIDAGVLTGSSIVTVQRHVPNLTILADTRTTDGVKQLFGTEVYPAHDLLAPTEWLHKNPDAARKLAGAVNRATKWMREHSPEEIRERMPMQYRAPDKESDLAALRATIPMLSHDGTVSRAGAEAVRNALAISTHNVRTASIDLSQTYTNEFVPAQ